MPARVPNAAGHTLTLEDDAATGGPLTNSGARTAGGLENIGTATSNTFTMTEVIKIKETPEQHRGQFLIIEILLIL